MLTVTGRGPHPRYTWIALGIASNLSFSFCFLDGRIMGSIHKGGVFFDTQK